MIFTRGVIAFLLGFALVGLFQEAHGRDLGQWGNTEPEVKAWFQALMQPDAPTRSCCGEADAYWCDDVHVRDGRTFCKITDDRDDKPLKRPHIDIGTEIEVPPNKIKWDRGNPTGHTIIFLASMAWNSSIYGRYVYCFVQSSGV